MTLSHELAEQLRARMRARNLSAAEGPIFGAARECVALHLGDPHPPELGSCRAGGVPDLPEGADWPRTGDGYFCFVAQFNLAELPQLTDRPVPASGMLYFFVGEDEPATDVSARWLYHPGPAARFDPDRVPPPDEQLNEYYSELTPHRLDPRAAVSLPELWWRVNRAIDIDGLCGTGALDRYSSLCAELLGDTATGFLFGHPSTINADVQLEAQLVRSGHKNLIYSTHRTPEQVQAELAAATGPGNADRARHLAEQLDGLNWFHSQRAEVEAAARRWRSLLTFHSSRALDLTIWDAGFFSSLIDSDDLARLDFSRAYTRVHSS
jgi:uncharacterized protein YwqG